MATNFESANPWLQIAQLGNENAALHEQQVETYEEIAELLHQQDMKRQEYKALQQRLYTTQQELHRISESLNSRQQEQCRIALHIADNARKLHKIPRGIQRDRQQHCANYGIVERQPATLPVVSNPFPSGRAATKHDDINLVEEREASVGLQRSTDRAGHERDSSSERQMASSSKMSIDAPEIQEDGARETRADSTASENFSTSGGKSVSRPSDCPIKEEVFGDETIMPIASVTTAHPHKLSPSENHHSPDIATVNPTRYSFAGISKRRSSVRYSTGYLASLSPSAAEERATAVHDPRHFQAKLAKASPISTAPTPSKHNSKKRPMSSRVHNSARKRTTPSSVTAGSSDLAMLASMQAKIFETSAKSAARKDPSRDRIPYVVDHHPRDVKGQKWIEQNRRTPHEKYLRDKREERWRQA